MWCGNLGYLLCLRIRGLRGLGRIKTLVLRDAEGIPCSWTSTAPRIRHQNAERWRRRKRWYRDVSRRNASTAWRAICIFCKILFSFTFKKYNFSNIYIFQVSFGTEFWPSVPEYVDEIIEALIAKKAPFVRLMGFFSYYLWFNLASESDSCLCGSTCHIDGATDRKNQIIRFGSDNQMVPTAIYIKSPGITSPHRYYLFNT